MIPLTVPEEDERALSDLAQLSDQEADRLIAAIKSSKPTLFVNQLIDDVADKSGLDPAKVHGIMRLMSVFELIRARHDITVLHLVDGISGTVERAASDALGGRHDVLKKRLVDLLSPEPLFVTAKALGVMRDHQRALCESRVITDLRPVFGSDEKPAGAVILHTLKLTYHEGPKRALREFFVAMNSDDLEELRAVLDRASRKQAELKPILARSGLPDLDGDSD